MEEIYEVYAAGEPVGKVQLKRQGLYVQVICRCQTPTDLIYRLVVQGKEQQENLGVVVPEGDGFWLNRRIPAKRLGEGPLRFVLSAGGAEKAGTFVPICPEEPFRYIDRLKTAFLQSENGKIGIRIEKHPEAG